MTSKAYILDETQISFNGEAGADVAFSMEGLTDGAGRVSAQKDWGSSARAFKYKATVSAQWQATPTQYGTLDFYLAESNDGTIIAGDVGSSDAALGDLDQVKNLIYIGSLVVEEADTTVMRAILEFESKARYFSVVGVNNGGATLNATDSNFDFLVTPFSVQGQAT